MQERLARYIVVVEHPLKFAEDEQLINFYKGMFNLNLRKCLELH